MGRVLDLQLHGSDARDGLPELQYVAYQASGAPVPGDYGSLGYGYAQPSDAVGVGEGWWWEANVSQAELSSDPAVPEPATMIVWSLLGAASWLGMRVWRGGQRISRCSWSSENRQAIHEIIARGTHY
jgi:hypothetical protein